MHKIRPIIGTLAALGALALLAGCASTGGSGTAGGGADGAGDGAFSSSGGSTRGTSAGEGISGGALEGGSGGNVPFPHRRHQESLKEGCQVCHDTFPQKRGSIEAMKAEGKLESKQVMNRLCTGCHRQYRRQGVDGQRAASSSPASWRIPSSTWRPATTSPKLV